MTDISPNLGGTDVDRLGKALLTLASELWVVKDRVTVLEAVLEEKGIDVTGLVESYQPDAKLTATLNKNRTAFIERLLASLEDK